MKNDTRLGAAAVPAEKAKKSAPVAMQMGRRPYSVERGPHRQGDNPIMIMYRALDMLMMAPDVLYVCATSGTAARIVVELIGARNPHSERMAVMASFRRDENRSYCAALTSTYEDAFVCTGWMSWFET